MPSPPPANVTLESPVCVEAQVPPGAVCPLGQLDNVVVLFNLLPPSNEDNHKRASLGIPQ